MTRRQYGSSREGDRAAGGERNPADGDVRGGVVRGGAVGGGVVGGGNVSGARVADVRLIAATTREADEATGVRRLITELRAVFSEDAGSRAPLRARCEDLRALAPHILRRQAELAGRTVPILSRRR